MHDPNQYYLFLGATPADSHEAIVRAHGARISSARAQGGFLLEMLNEAFACLSNPASRARYDQGSFPMNASIRAFREMLLADRRLYDFDRLDPDTRIRMYCDVLGADDATVEFGINPDGTLEDLKTGEKVEISGSAGSQGGGAGPAGWRSTNPADPKGYYAYFGLRPDASLRDITMAYAKVRSECSGIPLILSMAHEAYEVLCDPFKRHAYDNSALGELREGNVSLTVDPMPAGGAMLSGKIRFSDQQTAQWHVNQMGRLILLPAREGYEPGKADGEVFVRLVNKAIDRYNQATQNPPRGDTSYRTMGKPSASLD